ncbi:MAG: restriction endonuclease subunit S [Candidatus Competibacter sp.]
MTTGYKQTEVGVIPEDWGVVSALDACSKIQDGTHFSPQIGGSDYLYITSKNIRFGFLDISTAYRIDKAQHQVIYQRCDVKKGDLLLTKDGANTGNAALNKIDEEFSLLSSVAFLRFHQSKHCATYFLQQILTSQGQHQIQEAMAGNAITRLTLEKIKKLRFPIPPTLTEQQAIAEALSDADAFIESLEQLLAKKRHIKQGAMQELLTGKKRLPGFFGEWEVKRLGELAKIQRGASPRPIDSPIWFDENSSVGWVRISDVTSSDMYLHETTQRLSPLGIQNSRLVSRDSLIMSICATVGRPIITEIDTCIHDGFVVFDNLRANKHFLYYILKFIESNWSRHGQTGSQMNLNTGLINRTKVSMPPTTEEKTAIAAILSDMDAEIAAMEAKLAKARQIKQGMMRELLTGRIRLA